jgi:hypothetical protein
MHSRDLLDLSAIAAYHGTRIVGDASLIREERLEQYWAGSRSRQDRWGRSLKKLGLGSHFDRKMTTADRHALRSVLEEILTGEVLTRTWGAVLCGRDRLGGKSEGEAIARSVLLGQIEARHRALSILSKARGLNPEESEGLDQVRRRAERWTDLLVGHVCLACDVSEFAFHPERAREFRDDLAGQGRGPTADSAWKLLVTSLRLAFRSTLVHETANPDLNQRIATSVMACLPAEFFDSMGLLKSLWMYRIACFAEDTECLIADLFHDDRIEPGVPRPGSPRRF